MEWETIIGLEVHVQLKTQSKIFSGASTRYGASPNTQACAIDLALPGTLPVLNQEVITIAIKLGLAIHATINLCSIFERKNYFYPDLPKGYQISQYEFPIVSHGSLNIQLAEVIKPISIVRAHLEEDAGKSVHQDYPGYSGIDLNRAGVPLLEIVSAPDLRSAQEAVAYLKTLYNLVVSLEICDGNMQEGSFRCDANVSVRPKGQSTLGTRTEIKNLNSFRFVEKAIQYETARHIDILENKGHIIQETRLYDADKNQTRSMRLKEEAHDYRYFPDPDLLPLQIDPAIIEGIRQNLPELPVEKQQRFQQDYHLTAETAALLANDFKLAHYFEAILRDSTTLSPKLAATWVVGEVTAALHKDNLSITDSPVSATALAGLLRRIIDQTITGKMAKTIFAAMWQGEGSADELIQAKGLQVVSDVATLETIITQLITDHPQAFADLKAGKEKLLGFFVGKVMQTTQGKANPTQVNAIIREKIKNT